MRRLLGLAAAFLILGSLAGHAQPVDLENTLNLELTTGRVVIRMRPDLAPNHVARIKELTRKGFYDGTPFHRVIAGFMAQGGAKNLAVADSGTGLPPLKAEFTTKARFVRGVVGAARLSISNDSANSQFFIMLAANSGLDNQYTIWGEVISGMEFVDQIKKGEPPQNPDKIIRAQIAADAK